MVKSEGNIKPEHEEDEEDDEYEYIPDEYDEFEEDGGGGGMLSKICGICPLTSPLENMVGGAVDKLRGTIENLVSCNK